MDDALRVDVRDCVDQLLQNQNDLGLCQPKVGIVDEFLQRNALNAFKNQVIFSLRLQELVKLDDVGVAQKAQNLCFLLQSFQNTWVQLLLYHLRA